MPIRDDAIADTACQSFYSLFHAIQMKQPAVGVYMNKRVIDSKRAIGSEVPCVNDFFTSPDFRRTMRSAFIPTIEQDCPDCGNFNRANHQKSTHSLFGALMCSATNAHDVST
jgi:hypothetical protein